MTTRTKHQRPGIPTALVYTRVSSWEQAREGVSLDAQLAEARRYAAQHGWVLGTEYQDVLSGKRDDRPRYQALLADVRRLRAEGQAVVVVVLRLDRLGRRILERVRCREELKALGVPVHSVREGGEVSDLVANVLAAVAEEETRALGERVSVSKQHAIANGWFPSGRAPWGYRWRKATSEERAQGAPASALDVDPSTAPYAREAWERLAAGDSVRGVHAWVASLPESARGGLAMGFASVRDMLANPAYVARPAQGDPDVLARPVSRWSALIDDVLWRRARDQVAGHTHLPRQASRRHLLTGFIRCPNCGWRMQGRSRWNRSASYRCGARQQGARASNRVCSAIVLAGPVEAAVLDQVTPLIDLAASAVPELRVALKRAWQALRDPADAAAARVDRQLAQLEREADLARKRLTNAAVLFADGDIDKPGYELLRDKARADLDAAESEAHRLRQQVPPPPDLPALDAVLRDVGGWAVALPAGDIVAQREVLAALVKHVVPVRVGYGQYAAEVTWTSLGDALGQASGIAATPAAA